jgi:3-methyladenine DNA glycosylase AlkC
MSSRIEILSLGLQETNNLNECLKIDQKILFQSVFSQQYDNGKLSPILDTLEDSKELGILKKMRLIADQIIKNFPDDVEQIQQHLSSHPSDTARGWACFLQGHPANKKAFEEKLTEIRQSASDSHFGVREWAWLALRDDLEANLEQAIALFSHWTKDKNCYIRRFAIESIRPRGVWCKHIDQLKRSPEIVLPLLEALKADPEIYVQDSVSNWLNDASKSSPDWVIEVCHSWESEKNLSKYTQRIIKRALRTLTKKGV